MFTLDDYRVSFNHTHFDPNFDLFRGYTHCFISKDDKAEFMGVAWCSTQDQFNKATGRKVALTRALKPFDKETRTRFWNAYWEAGGKK